MLQFNNVKVFTDNIDQATLNQIHEMRKSGVFEGLQIRIMPDTHCGKGSVIGFTVPIADKVIPNIVGVDICCGMHVVELGNIEIDFERLDDVVHQYVPAGREIGRRRQEAVALIKQLRCYRELRNIDRLEASLGTLGGGNHFIEVDADEEGDKYLVIHSGSRNLGKQVAELYQWKAIRERKDRDSGAKELIKRLKEEGRQHEIEQELKKLKEQSPALPDALCYITGQNLEDYLHDMRICEKFANTNREIMAANIVRVMKWKPLDSFTVLHNYIGKDNVIRKGAISAYEGARVFIPLNMRDGCIIGRGKGNPDWNYSAPHGAGRIMSRSEAKKQIALSDFKETMKGIYSTTVEESTIDEAPFAYKPSEEIIELVKDTVEIEKIVKPIYNFKAAEV